jgi:hypothetical protein
MKAPANYDGGKVGEWQLERQAQAAQVIRYGLMPALFRESKGILTFVRTGMQIRAIL